MRLMGVSRLLMCSATIKTRLAIRAIAIIQVLQEFQSIWLIKTGNENILCLNETFDLWCKHTNRCYHNSEKQLHAE
jgi:hypothetical protein